MARLLVIVPTLNERENLPELAAAILAQPVGAELLVVDDASPDGTGAVADELARADARVHVLHRPARLGIGSAYVQGFQRALAEGYDRVVTMDADWSHDPSYLPALVEPADRYDLVVGSRYLHGISVVNWSLARLALSSAGNAYVRAITRLPLRDCTSGFQCIRADALARIGLEHIRTNGYSFLVELKYRLARRGCSILEVPIVFTQRRHGRTKMTREQIILSLLNVWRLRLGLYRG
ncbi:MAG TPA: polyprenol monophosphomannose synthase [Candidatus Limnocylindria bacterium]|nr:polyprenol monophosphomannose synthase [Candidatus Limnocylindria bacterium]